MTTEYTDIAAAIMGGFMDERIKDIEFQIKSRKDYLKNNMMRQLLPGDIVVVDHIRPKAICGLKATVKKVNRTTLSVVFGPDAGRHSGPCKVPASCCEKVS